ncbi:RNA polymerase sigma factor [Microbacterium sp.]|uniref:RNA polymerase sigma factor n=1 Tax=Microbacterium sp. TaxID=51671 RepID=UPI0039E70E63
MTAIDPADTRSDDDRDDGPGRWERATEAFVQWRGGDARAMDELVRLMTPVLWHVVRAYGIDHALAEDVVQTTWVTLVRRHESITDERAVAGWLMTCARREAWRSGRGQRRANPTDNEVLEAHLPIGESAEHVAQLSERDSHLWASVRKLDARCQRLLRIVAFDERPDYARIATDLAMPVGSIGPTRQRCLVKLRSLLEGAGWGRER